MAKSAEVVKTNASLLSKEMGNQIVQLIVGKNYQLTEVNGQSNPCYLFSVHKNLLSTKSRVFAGMFNGHFMEGKNGIANLPEDSPETFHSFVGWLYSDIIEDLDAINLGPYIDMISFGTKYCVTEFTDLALEAMIVKMKAKKWVADMKDIEQPYAITGKTTKLRLYMARAHAYALMEFDDVGEWSSENLVPTGPDSVEILADFHRIMRTLRKKKLVAGKAFLKDPSLAPKCEYHAHDINSPCPYFNKKRKLGQIFVFLRLLKS